MSRFPFVALSLALGFVSVTGCADLTGLDLCGHSEGCGGGGGSGLGGGWNFNVQLSFHGKVAVAGTGVALAGAAVRIDLPVRKWSEQVVTNSAGGYSTVGLPHPAAGDCTGLSVTFSREGFEPFRVTEFPGLSCVIGSVELNATLTPTK
jgi:hypothetical protein